MIGRAAAYARKYSRSLVSALALITLAGGLVYSLLLGDVLRYGDEVDYYVIGGNIVDKHQFTLDGTNPTAWRPPGYPLAIAAFRSLGLGVFSIRMANFVFLALAIWFLYRILQTVRLPLAGVISGFLVLGYPVLFYAAGTLFPQIMASSLFLLVIWLCARDADWQKEMALGGLAFGYLILAVPYFLLVLPTVAIHPWVLGQRAKWSRAALLVGVAACVVSAWTCRNYVVFHRLIPVSTNNGVNLLQGNNDNTRALLGGGVAAADVDLSRYTAEAKVKFGNDEIAISSFYRERALEWVKTHKWEAAKLYLLKCLYHFSYRNDLSIKSEQSRTKDLIMLLTYGPLLAVFIVRMTLLRRYRPSRLEWMMILIYVANVLCSAVFYPRIRFRLPFDFLLVALVATFLDRLLPDEADVAGIAGPAEAAA